MKMLLRIFSWFGVNTLAIIIGVIVSTALFVILPYTQYLSLKGSEVGPEVHQLTNLKDVMPQRKPKVKPPEPKKTDLKPKSNDAPKSMNRSRFAMDLGVGGTGGSGGVAIGGGGSSGDVQSYAEGETDNDATPIRQTPPAYPDAARKAGISGKVRALLTIDENGNVADVKILESPGDYGFEGVIRDAVSKWRYKPAEVNGIPVRQKLEQPFEF